MMVRAPWLSGLELTVILHGPVGLVAEQPVRVVAGGQVLAVDGQDVVPRLHVDAHLRQRRAVDRLLVLARQDAGDLVPPRRHVEGELGAGQRDLRARRDFPVATRVIGVADVQFPDHLADDIVEVGAVGDVLQQGR